MALRNGDSIALIDIAVGDDPPRSIGACKVIMHCSTVVPERRGSPRPILAEKEETDEEVLAVRPLRAIQEYLEQQPPPNHRGNKDKFTRPASGVFLSRGSKRELRSLWPW